MECYALCCMMRHPKTPSIAIILEIESVRMLSWAFGTENVVFSFDTALQRTCNQPAKQDLHRSCFAA